MLIAILGCSPSDPPSPPSPAIASYVSKDGSHFRTAQGSIAALPANFPAYLIYPQAEVVSSGQIRDRSGGIASLLLQVKDSEQAIVRHYRRQLWLKGWEVLSQISKEGVTILTLEQVERLELPHLQRQVVIQIGSKRNGKRDLLILLSSLLPEEPRSAFGQWLLQNPQQTLLKRQP